MSRASRLTAAALGLAALCGAPAQAMTVHVLAEIGGRLTGSWERLAGADAAFPGIALACAVAGPPVDRACSESRDLADGPQALALGAASRAEGFTGPARVTATDVEFVKAFSNAHADEAAAYGQGGSATVGATFRALSDQSVAFIIDHLIDVTGGPGAAEVAVGLDLIDPGGGAAIPALDPKAGFAAEILDAPGAPSVLLRRIGASEGGGGQVSWSFQVAQGDVVSVFFGAVSIAGAPPAPWRIADFACPEGFGAPDCPGPPPPPVPAPPALALLAAALAGLVGGRALRRRAGA